ncbi:MAG: hypothetical protein ABI112_18185 [Terracoccus sp.]
MNSTRHRPSVPRWRRARSGAVALGVFALAAPIGAVATTSTATASPTASPTASQAAAPYCGITWGSLPQATAPGLLWTGNVTGTRSGRHPCYDRVVFDVAKGHGTLGYSVRYVNQVTGPSGLPVALTGGAKLQVTLNAPSTLAPSTTAYAGWPAFRQLKFVDSFEGYTDYGLGVRARLPMRAFVLANADGSQRLVVDVANRW